MSTFASVVPKEPQTNVKLTLLIPASLYDHYENVANREGKPVEEVIQTRLSRCRDHDAGQGIYLKDDHRRELTHLLGGHQLKDAEFLVSKIRTLCKVSVGGITVEVSPTTMSRLKRRSQIDKYPLEKIIQREFEKCCTFI